MRINYMWMIFLILPYALVTSRPAGSQENHHAESQSNFLNIHHPNAQNIPKLKETLIQDEQIISVRITSSVAVGRTKPRTGHKISNKNHEHRIYSTTPSVDELQTFATTTVIDIASTAQTTVEDVDSRTELPPKLLGANIAFLKQLQAKKETRGLNNYERLHPFHLEEDQLEFNQTTDSVAESSVHSVLENDELINNVPLARSVPLSYSSEGYIQDPQIPRGSSRLTSVNFNVVHDSPKVRKYDIDPISTTYLNSNQNIGELQKLYDHHPQSNVQFSQPSQIYSEPAKFYSEPAKIYSEPAKIYGEPAKIYSEPAKIYSEPAKFYSPPASLHLSPEDSSSHESWQKQSATSTYRSTILSSTPNSVTNPTSIQEINTERIGHEAEKNYEIDEKISVMTDGRTHGEQPSGSENCKQENCKIGYVVEGRQFRKYRVEERTSDGFIVGEYGVVRNEDGALRGVRYTADSDASPRLIHDALMKFLQLK